MKHLHIIIAISTCVLSSLSANAALPSDVKPSDPAANAVQRVLGMHLMKDHGGKFAGNSSVSRAEVAKALKGMAEAIVSKHWVKAKSAPLTVKRVDSLAASKGWKTQVVSRYSLAISIIKMGDYLVNGIHRAAPDATDTGQSTSKIMRKPALPKGRASDASLKYLVKNRMMWEKSPLLLAGNSTITADEMSTCLAQLMIGLNDKLTSLNFDAEGQTKDATFHKPKVK